MHPLQTEWDSQIYSKTPETYTQYELDTLTVTVNAIGFHKFDILLGNSPLLAFVGTMTGPLFTLNGVRADPFEYRAIELRNILLGCSINDSLRWDSCELMNDECYVVITQIFIIGFSQQ